jgi:hypothetical protein
VLAACSYAYSQDKVPSLDAGTVKDSTYTNTYFAMRFRIPDGWQVQDNQATRALLEQGRTLVAGDDKNLNAMISASEQKSLTLLTMFRHPLGSPVEFNPSFVCIVEKTEGLPGIKKGSDYLFHVRKGLVAAKLQITIEKDIYTGSVDRLEFGILETKLAIGKTTVQQKYYSTILKGYALSFIISYTSDEELQTQNEIIRSIKFQ